MDATVVSGFYWKNDNTSDKYPSTEKEREREDRRLKREMAHVIFMGHTILMIHMSTKEHL